jgi:hypothetical protein
VALNHDGMPVGVVLYDPLEGRQGEAHFIGARLAKREARRPDVLAKRGNVLRKDRRAPRYVTRVEHDMTPQRVPHTAHHIVAIESGSLIPANEATAKIARVPFVAPAVRLAAARDAAIANWTREYGAPPPVASWPVLAIPAVPQENATGPAVVATGAPAAVPTSTAAPAPAPSVAPAVATLAPAPAASPLGAAGAPPSSAATPIAAPPATAAAPPPVVAPGTLAAAAPPAVTGTPAPGAPPPSR